MANRLATETSPYLAQHADNPVDWYPWGEEAFAAARERDVPIFLSVGYSSCHWCHVMAHESFEDPDIAAQMNARFVNVKVDREERPDVDAVYMRAVQAMTGRGGWPMSVFMTPEGRPFFTGTYWPREPHHGMPDFPKVIAAIGDAWVERREEVLGSADTITTALASQREEAGGGALDLGVVDEAASVVLTGAWDRELGGFGRAPKFPQAMTIEWLLTRHRRTGDPEARDAAVHALDAMARGGIHDQIAGGFARYSTDAAWLVPHFEKMLYDNALLLPAYASGARVTGREDLARVARSTAAYLLGELRTDDGGFVSATDADSEGEEGRYFVWSATEFAEACAAAGVDADTFAAFHGVTDAGNFEGRNILHEPVDRDTFCAARDLDVAAFTDELARLHAELRDRRATRVPPGVDDKVLTDWNAMAVRGLVRAGLLLDEPDWVEAARTTATMLHERHVVDGRLHHTRSGPTVSVPAFLDDHALLALADLELFAATGETVWFERGLALATEANARFHDADDGGWFQTAADAEALILRPKETWDNATPAGTSVMIEVCLQLAGLTGELAWRRHAEQALRAFQGQARTMATGYGWFLRQMETLTAGPVEVAIVGAGSAERAALVATARAAAGPGTLVVVADADHDGSVPLLRDRGEIDGRPAAYVCRALVCDRPVTEPAELAALLEG
ncbi:MAG: thioredoxin domain-containing protein [Nitriliruptoraceae bacterium]|nr:thioredoxin domain-containing protein [Nitriliruptoraceae bacterium]